MSEFRTIPPKLTKDEWNALLDHGLEKPPSYIIRKVEEEIQAINGRTGKIDFRGTNISTVTQSAINALERGKIFLKDLSFPANVTLKDKIIVEEMLNGIISFYQLKQPTVTIPDTSKEGLILYLPMENIMANRVIDVSPLNNESKNYGATLTAGKCGKALSFDVGKYVELVPSVLEKPEEVTIACFVFVRGFPMEFVSLISDRSPDPANVVLYARNTRVFRAHIHTSPSGWLILETATTFELNTWVHVAMTWKRPNLRLYVNAVEVIHSPVTRDEPKSALSGKKLRIGKDDIHESIDGIIDEVHIYNRALTPEEIKQLYLSDRLRYGTLESIEGKLKLNKGTATITAGATSVTVPHGLAETPRIVKHCPRANLGAVWVSARDATNITLNAATAPTVDTITDWEAEL